MTSKKTRIVKVNLAAWADSLAIQLKKQGLKFDQSVISDLNKQNKYIESLRFADILTIADTIKAKNKLFKKIQDHIGADPRNHKK